MIIEKLFGKILEIEQLRRDKPSLDDQEAVVFWNSKLQGLLSQIWEGLRIWGPLYET